MSAPDEVSRLLPSESSQFYTERVNEAVVNSSNGIDGFFEETFKKGSVWARARYYIPILSWLPNYSFSLFLGDFVAGTSVAFLIIPQGLSYASLAQMPPIYGLYGAFFPLVIYTIFGTSRQMSVGPEAVVSLIIGAATSLDEEISQEERMELVLILSFLVGLITLVMGCLRLGFLDAIFSKATNRGFITGVAFVVMTEQLLKFFGIETEWEHTSSPIQKLIHVFSHLNEVQWLPTVFAICAFSFLLIIDFLKRRYPKFLPLKFLPAILIVVVVSILFSWGLGLDQYGLKILQDVDGGFVAPRWPAFTPTRLALMTPNAIVVVIVGFVESIIVAKLYATKNSYAISDNRELVAMGAANLFASFFGAYSSFGSMPRTRMNDAAGAKTQMAGFISSIYAFFTIMFLLFLFYYLPMAILGAIVMFAAYSLLEFHDFVYFYKVKAWQDLIISLACMGITYFIGVEVGVFFTLAISIVLVIKNVTKDIFVSLGYDAEADDYLPLSSKHSSTQPVRNTIIIQMLDSMFFANTSSLKERLRRIEMFGSLAIHPGNDKLDLTTRLVVFDFERTATVDPSALHVILELFEDYNRRGIEIAVVKANSAVELLFERAGLMQLARQNRVYISVREAVNTSKINE